MCLSVSIANTNYINACMLCTQSRVCVRVCLSVVNDKFNKIDYWLQMKEKWNEKSHFFFVKIQSRKTNTIFVSLQISCLWHNSTPSSDKNTRIYSHLIRIHEIDTDTDDARIHNHQKSVSWQCLCVDTSSLGSNHWNSIHPIISL